LNGTALAAPTKNSHEQAHTLQKKYTISFGKMWLAGCSTRRLVSDWNLCFSCFPKKLIEGSISERLVIMSFE